MKFFFQSAKEGCNDHHHYVSKYIVITAAAKLALKEDDMGFYIIFFLNTRHHEVFYTVGSRSQTKEKVTITGHSTADVASLMETCQWGDQCVMLGYTYPLHKQTN